RCRRASPSASSALPSYAPEPLGIASCYSSPSPKLIASLSPSHSYDIILRLNYSLDKRCQLRIGHRHFFEVPIPILDPLRSLYQVTRTLLRMSIRDACPAEQRPTGPPQVM